MAEHHEGALRSSSGSPLIFISHDTRDASLAEAFSKLLNNVSAGVLKSFRSSDRSGTQGIDFGIEWYPELMSKLETASDVVCLLTQRSLDRPWILYEAGVAKGKLSTPVYGIALGVPLGKASIGPFAQFQNSDDDEESLTKLVMQLVRRIPGSEPDHDAVLMQVRSFKTRADEVANTLADSDKALVPVQPDSETSVAKIFEEIKVMFQDLPQRIEGRVFERSIRSRRTRRFHPKMVHEFAYLISERGDDPVGLLVTLSFIRDDFPWLYEMGLDVYRSIVARDFRASEQAIARFVRAADLTLRGPFREELGPDSKEMFYLLEVLPMLFNDLASNCMKSLLPSVQPAMKEKISEGVQEKAP